MLNLKENNEQCFDLTAEQYRKENIENPITVTPAQLEEKLIKLGIRKGMKLVVHSTLSSLGNLQGGAEAVCKSLMKLVSQKGLLMMPSFNLYSGLTKTNGIYDWEKTPSVVGAVTECFRKMPEVIRSLNPSHPIAAWGKNNLQYIKDHHKLPTMHRNSPLGLLEQENGHALLISCPESISFMHVVEFTNNVQCLGCRTEEYPVKLPDGRLVKCRTWGWRKGHCRALRHDEIYEYMRKQKTLKECMFNRAHLMLFKLSDYRKAYEPLLNSSENGCIDCLVRPREVDCNVAGDWDFKNDKLLGTDAFTDDFPCYMETS